MEGLRVQDAQCMRDLFEERDKSKPKILKEQKRSLKLEADDQQQSTLRRDQPVLTKEEEHLERTPSEQGRNEQLVREKTELQQLVSRIKKKHSEEVEALDEEIEQLKTVAVELGFL
ncbi:unnamed protein product [Cylindrotheca closterium]|uniref:Uncharacterized protein n=1 Tax=Cylindrotheca closterium TaxID=2856 RepID=A0AAD2CFQ2_9STRA|nr:unnamed protein product [Cylindrotheca closterium]